MNWLSPRGEVIVRSFFSPDQIASLTFRNVQTKYARYRPLVSHKEKLAERASKPDANVTLAHTRDGEIIGFGILEYPPPEERWARVGDRAAMEVSAIEVNKPWRSRGISERILQLLLDHPLKEDRILYMVGYSWTWDLDGKEMPAMAYRNMLMKLFSRHGFKSYQTNEPNVMLRPENLFMARIGSHVPEEVQKKFKLVRFDLDRFV